MGERDWDTEAVKLPVVEVERLPEWVVEWVGVGFQKLAIRMLVKPRRNTSCFVGLVSAVLPRPKNKATIIEDYN